MYAKHHRKPQAIYIFLFNSQLWHYISKIIPLSYCEYRCNTDRPCPVIGWKVLWRHSRKQELGLEHITKPPWIHFDGRCFRVFFSQYQYCRYRDAKIISRENFFWGKLTLFFPLVTYFTAAPIITAPSVSAFLRASIENIARLSNVICVIFSTLVCKICNNSFTNFHFLYHLLSVMFLSLL